MANYYPQALSFHFRVEIDGITSDGGQPAIHCQSVSGLKIGNDTTEDFFEGGENTFQHHLPKPIAFSSVTLVRAMVTQSSQFTQWVLDAVQAFQYDPRTMRVILLNDKHEPLEYWTFVNAYPVSMSISDFDSKKSEVVTETIKFSYQYFFRGNQGGTAGAVVRNIISNFT